MLATNNTKKTITNSSKPIKNIINSENNNNHIKPDVRVLLYPDCDRKYVDETS